MPQFNSRYSNQSGLHLHGDELTIQVDIKSEEGGVGKAKAGARRGRQRRQGALGPAGKTAPVAASTGKAPKASKSMVQEVLATQGCDPLCARTFASPLPHVLFIRCFSAQMEPIQVRKTLRIHAN